MNRVLLEIGEFQIYSYGFMISLAVIVGLFLLYRQGRRVGYDPEMLLESVLFLCVSGIIGARLLHVLLSWETYSQDFSQVLRLRDGGLSYHGALGLALLVFFIWCRWRGFSFLHLADLYVPYVALGYAFGRVGCFLNGCCYGVESDVPWAVVIPVVDQLPRHPVQLYAAAASLAIFVVLWYMYRIRPFAGFNLLLLMALYGLMRFGVEFFRDSEPFWNSLSLAQVASLALFLAAGVLIVVITWKTRSKQ